MHRPTRERLEEILSTPGVRLPADLQRHLVGCEKCREQLRRFAEHSSWVQLLRAPDGVRPEPGFSARVTDRIRTQQYGSMWSVFLQPAFGRRLILATLALTLVLGTLVAFQEAEDSYGAPPPEAIMAIEDHPPDLGADLERDRQTILVTLATYQE